ncbi:MAG TPA: DUF6798 domain-containing protein [Pirellulales bacterium]|nr:DUF6798 domain-containing protein [Pirellulales bacterium]
MSIATTSVDSLGPPGPPVHARWLPAVEVVAIFLVFAAQAAWPVPDVNEPHYLGKARHYWNPAWAPRDFFFESADTHLLFYVACGWLTRWLTLPQFAWFGRLITWFLLAWAWRRLSWRLAPRPGWAVVTALMFLAINVGGQLAGEWVVGGFEAKGLAYVLVFTSLHAYLDGRWNTALVWAGAASAVHVLVGGWFAVALGLCWLMSADRPPLRRLWPGLLGGFALSLVGVWPALALNRGVEPQTIAEANDIYVFGRLRHHLLPQAFGWAALARYLAMLIGWLVVVRVNPIIGRQSPRWHSAQNDAECPLGRLRRLVVATLAISLAGLMIAVATAERPEWAAAFLRYYWFRLGDVMPPLGIALSAGACGARLARSRGLRLAGCIALTLVLAAASRQEYAISGLFRQVPRGDRPPKVVDYADWRDACEWISRHTPDDALVITPRTAQTFTWYAGRGEVASWKDLPQDAAAIVEWWRRLEEIHGTRLPEVRGRWHESLTELPAARLRRLAEKYGAGYLLTEAGPRLPLPLVYSNHSYAVYQF